MAAPAEPRERLRGPCRLLPFVRTGSGLRLHAPLCPLNTGPGPQAVGIPGLDPQGAARAPFSQGSDCSFRASCRL